ncbi:MAG TPA: methyltransferase domain-containing protein [Caulobacteraceae bacterium]
MSERERYGLGYGEATHAWMRQRAAESHAGFFAPHLKSGMRLLDCGCGPGSISVGLARLVAPGDLVGVDLSPQQVARAQTLAAETEAANAAFGVGDAYALPFDDASFDAVFAHATLFHLREPAKALAEFRRLLRPDGVLGVRDPDYADWALTPATDDLSVAQSLLLRLSRHEGASPTYAGHLAELLASAGFTNIEVATRTAANRPSGAYAQRLIAMRDTVLGQDWADAAALDRLIGSLRAWSQHAGAGEHLAWREAVARPG